MLVECLEWLFTPCSWQARWNGSLARQIAIRHRHRRCRTAWAAHLEFSRSTIQSHLPSRNGLQVVVLGSGHLHDVPWQSLTDRVERLSLVDLLHPLEVLWRARHSRGRIHTHIADVFQPSPSLRALVAGADLCVSTCLLSQLALDARADWIAPSALAANHWNLLSNARHALLITDIAARSRATDPWDFLFDPAPLPPHQREWIWPIIPAGESPAGPQERLVRVFARP